MTAYRYEVQCRVQTTRARGQGVERRGGRNCGTYHGETWKQRAVSNSLDAAIELIRGMGRDWRVFDNTTGEAVPQPKEQQS